MNSSTPGTKGPSRRSKWGRRLLWSGICLASLLTLYYQWENRRSARELQAAHIRMLERIGTDDWIAFAMPGVPDEQNFFALPILEKWLHHDGERVKYVIPENVFLPQAFIKPPIIEEKAGGTSRVDFASWAAGRDLKGEKPAAAMNRELGDGNGLLPHLAAGLSRPFSAWKPAQRETYSVAGANPYAAAQPHPSNVNNTMRDLGLHLRVAAAAGDVEKTRTTALILLRLFPEAATSHSWLIGSLVSIAAHGLAFEALQDALGYPSWDEGGLHMLQLQLGKINDLEVMERGMSMEVLNGFGVGIYMRETCRKGWAATADLRFSSDDDPWHQSVGGTATRLGYIYGPTGWHDASTAFYVETYLDMLGPKGDAAWLDGHARGEELKKRRDEEYRHLDWNMRRKIGALALPNVGNLFDAAAQALFRRRCLIIACALEKHRMRHGGYPPSLDAVKNELSPFAVHDPARPKQVPGYSLEGNGYLLRSAGTDGSGDGGQAGNKFVWHMKFNPELP